MAYVACENLGYCTIDSAYIYDYELTAATPYGSWDACIISDLCNSSFQLTYRPEFQVIWVRLAKIAMYTITGGASSPSTQ